MILGFSKRDLKMEVKEWTGITTTNSMRYAAGFLS